MMRCALIDIGSNTSKVLIAELDESGNRKVLAQSSLPCRLLSLNKDQEPGICELATARLIDCINHFKELMKAHAVSRVRAVGTEAMRRAENATRIIEEIRQRTGLNIEILNGEQEAQAVADGLLTDGALQRLDSFIALDLGGGSMELIKIRQRNAVSALSLPIGAVALAASIEQDPQLPIGAKSVESLKFRVLDILRERAHALPRAEGPLVGCGGTLVFLRRLIEMKNSRTDAEITLTGVIHFLEMTASLGLGQRIEKFPDLPPDRADVFPYGLIALSSTMQFLGRDSLTHSYHNLRHGLIFQQPLG